mgnify:FL=1
MARVMLRASVAFALGLLLVDRTSAEEPERPRAAIETGGHVLPLTAIATSGDGTLVATGSEDGTVRVWRRADAGLVETHRLPSGMAVPVRLAIDGDSILLDDGVVRRSLARSSGSITAGMGLAIGRGDRDGRGRALLIVRRDEVSDRPPDAVRLVDANGKAIAEYVAPAGLTPWSARFSPDGRRVAVGFLEVARIDLLGGDDLRLAGQPDLRGVGPGDLRAVAFSSDGQWLFAAGSWSAKEGLAIVRRWADGGGGAFTDLAVARGEIVELIPMPDGGVAWAGTEPGWGASDAAMGRVAVAAGATTIDMRARRLRVDERGEAGRRHRHEHQQRQAKEARFGMADAG